MEAETNKERIRQRLNQMKSTGANGDDIHYLWAWSYALYKLAKKGEATELELHRARAAKANAIDDTARFYRDSVIKLLGLGIMVTLVMAGWFVSVDESRSISYVNPKEEAANTGAAAGTQEYQKAFDSAVMKRDRAIGVFVIIPICLLFWVIAVLVAYLKSQKYLHPTILKWYAVIPYSLMVIGVNILLLILVLKD